VLQSQKDQNWYTGHTKNLKKRLKEHNDGKNLSTKNRRPLKLIYFEGCLNEEDSRARKKYLKSGMGKRYIKNRLKRNLNKVNF
jgi:putative endonuclease